MIVSDRPLSGEPCVSLVIPVFRAENGIREAVASALSQTETLEVILVEDGSPDGSLEVCRALATEHPERVRLLQHPGGANLGAGASRNLGIENARAPFVAFLDADDMMLPGRFAASVPILLSERTVDGVYEAVQVQFSDEALRHEWLSSGRPELITVREPLPPEDLLNALLRGGKGYFHTNGVLVRRTAFEIVGLFNPDLRLAQDSEMWWRLAAACRLVGGNLDEPVAIHRRYPENRFQFSSGKFLEAQFNAAVSLSLWGRRNSLPRTVRIALRRHLLYHLLLPAHSLPSLRRRINYRLRRFRLLLFHHPKLLLSLFDPSLNPRNR